MTFVQTYLFHRKVPSPRAWASSVLSTFGAGPTSTIVASATERLVSATSEGFSKQTAKGFWETDGMNAREKLNPSRLQDQMFAFTVTNQVVNTFLEIGLPFVLRAVDSVRNGRGLSFSNPTSSVLAAKKKRVMFEDEASGSEVAKNANGKEEREFMELVRREVALPEYSLFVDYSEMVTQFGYVALWSTIWPLAPGKLVVHRLFASRSIFYFIQCTHANHKNFFSIPAGSKSLIIRDFTFVCHSDVANQQLV